jgi:crotonobetainyl-CoA:carnitine CoA-transferase CaiB-like acyl-CoA transferase
VAVLEAGNVPCGPVNTIDRVFEDPQVKARGMKVDLPHPLAGEGTVPLIANPVKLSGTPIHYRHAPPTLGQHTDEVLAEVLGMSEAEIAAERAKGGI